MGVKVRIREHEGTPLRGHVDISIGFPEPVRLLPGETLEISEQALKFHRNRGEALDVVPEKSETTSKPRPVGRGKARQTAPTGTPKKRAAKGKPTGDGVEGMLA